MLNVPLESEFPRYLSKISLQSPGKTDINSQIFKINWVDAVPLKNIVIFCNPNQQYKSTNVQS